MFHLLILIGLVGGPASDDSLHLASRGALAAVEGDSVAAVRHALERRARDQTDPAARLGLAYLSLYTYDYRDADRRFQALRDSNPAGGPLAAYAQLGLAQSALGRGQVARGDTLVRAAVQGLRLAGAPFAQAEALLLEALAAARLRGAASAESTLARAAQLMPPGGTALHARALCVRAQLTTARNLAQARRLALDGVHVARVAGALRPEGYCLFVAAGAIGNEGNVDSSLALFAAAEAVQHRAHDRAGRAATLQWRGYAFYDIGSYGESRRALTEALADGAASGNLSPVAWGHLIFAELNLATGELDAIAGHVNAAESLFASTGDAKLGAVGLANFEVQRARVVGDTARARAAAERFAAGADRYGWHWPVFAQRELAFVEMDAGNWVAAGRHLDSARVRARQLRATALALAVDQDAGILALKRGDARAARDILQRVVAQIPAEEGAFRHYSRTQLALALLRLGDIDRAVATARGAADDMDRWRAGLDDRRLRQTAFDLRRFEDPSFAVANVVTGLAAAGRLDAAFDLAERRRARNLLDRMVLAEGLATAPAHASRSAAPVLDARAIAAAIPDDSTAILEFARGSGTAPTAVFVLTRNGLRAIVLPPVADLARRVSRFTGLLEAGAGADSLATTLGEDLVAPLLYAVGPATRLVIVPDLELHGVPFEPLRVGGRPLVDRFSISYAPSASVMARLWLRERVPAAATLLAFGDARFAREVQPGTAADVLGAAFQGNGGLPRLRASAREARAVARYAEQADVHLRDHASEAALKRAPRDRYRVVHLATHALVDDRSPARTALALTPGDGEDGFVTPSELAALRLAPDLLVLSGCRTARGVLAGGEGVDGLAAPAIEVGARAVLASNWLVGDEQSGRFMERFYGHVASAGRCWAKPCGTPSSSCCGRMPRQQCGRASRCWEIHTRGSRCARPRRHFDGRRLRRSACWRSAPTA